MKRTHIPLNGLRVYDAAARHLSFTRAADELAVTPAAVGQQIRALEDTLGVVLFRRTPKGLELTPEAENGLGALRAGFLQFEESVRAMQAAQSSKSLTIAAPRAVVAKWLMPRLMAYAQADDDLRVTVVNGDDAIDFTEANLDLAVRYADSPDGHEAVAIDDGGMLRIGDDAAPLIGWPGMAGGSDATLRLADAGLAIDAVASGMGRSVVPALLARDDLAAGRIETHARADAVAERFWLVAPLPQWRQKKVRQLVAALTASGAAS